MRAATRSLSRCVAAISHWAFLRMMMAAILDISLVDALKLSFHNACINVVDFPLDRTSQTNPTRLLLASSLAVPESPSAAEPLIQTPVGHVLRLNECRHLKSLEV